MPNRIDIEKCVMTPMSVRGRHLRHVVDEEDRADRQNGAIAGRPCEVA
jgi:hypothetical protein